MQVVEVLHSLLQPPNIFDNFFFETDFCYYTLLCMKVVKYIWQHFKYFEFWIANTLNMSPTSNKIQTHEEV